MELLRTLDRVPPSLPLPPHHHYTHHQKRLGAMNPESKLLLDVMKRLFDEQNERLDKRFAEAEVNIERRITDSELRQDTRITDKEHRHDDRLQAVEKVMTSLASWRLEAEGLVDDLRLEVGELNKHWDRSMRVHSITSPDIIPVPPSLEQADQCPPADAMAARPIGHCDDNRHWKSGFGVVTTLTHSLV